MEANQLDLFADNALPKSACKPESLCMDTEALVQWKMKIAAHQQRMKENQLVQGTLFEVARTHFDPDKIDPFNLCLCPMSFYRLPVDSPGAACIYFVLDSAAGLILYIGKTCRSNIRLIINKPAQRLVGIGVR